MNFFTVAIVLVLGSLTKASHHSRQKMKVEHSNGMFIVRNMSANVDNINLADYDQWSPWSKCRKRCKQVRTRMCKAASCEWTILKEERDCTGHQCRMPIGKSRKQRPRGQRGQIRILYHLQRYIYSPWSNWEGCKAKTCHTTRYRVCMNPNICKNSIIQEDALCYTPGSECERQYKPQIEPTELERVEEELEPSNQVTSDLPSIDDQECGVASPHTNIRSMLKIIGGRSARRRWPWMVAILNRHKQHFCGGTLISPQFVVTAAHCVKHQQLYVLAGEHNFKVDEETEQTVAVSEIIRHPEYDNFTVDNDIALLKLEKPLLIDDYVSPICLPSPNDQMATNRNGTILGWGKKRNSKMSGTKVLQEAKVPIADTEDCKNVYKKYQITENMVCAGYKEGQIDSCSGDSGGPLMFRRKDQANKRNKWFLYGITSFGEGCGKKGKYGIYAKVPNMVNWIRQSIQGK